jgi:hypothetical protein
MGRERITDEILVQMKEKTEVRPDRRPHSLVLRGEETVVVVARPSRLLSLPKYVVTLGLYGIWRKRQTYVLTDQRVLIGQGVFRRAERSIPISRIEDASFVRKGIGAYCEVIVESHGRQRAVLVGPLSPKSARRFTNEIQART